MSETSRNAKGRRRTVVTVGTRPAESIYAATTRLLDRTPFDAISVAQILDEADISRATFYFYFSSKFSVLCGLLETAMNDMFEMVQPFLARSPDDSPQDAVERSIRSVAGAWHRHRAVLQAAALHWHSDPELHTLWLSIVERFVTAGADEIDRERAAGHVTSEVPSRTLATVLFWGTERVLNIAGQGIERTLPDEEAAVEPLIAMWRGTLYGR